MTLRRLPFLVPLLALAFAATAGRPAGAQPVDTIDLPASTLGLEYVEGADVYLVLTRSDEPLSYCSTDQIVVLDRDGNERWRAPVAPCDWLAHDGLLIIRHNQFDIASFDLETGAAVRSWTVPNGRRATDLFAADRTLYFNQERPTVGLQWGPDGVGSLLLDHDDGVASGAFGSDRLRAISADGRYLWLQNGLNLTRLDQADQSDAPTTVLTSTNERFYLTEDETFLYSNRGRVLDAHSLEVLDIVESPEPNPRTLAELPNGLVIGYHGRGGPGPFSVYQPGTLTPIASGPALPQAVVGWAIVDGRLAVRVGDEVSLHDVEPIFTGLALDEPAIEAGTARTVRLHVEWLDAVEQVTVAGTPVPFRIDENYYTRTIEVDLPPLAVGSHPIVFDGPLGRSASAPHNELVVQPPAPRSELVVAAHPDSRAALRFNVDCLDPVDPHAAPADVLSSLVLQPGEQRSFTPKVGLECTVRSERQDHDEIGLGREWHLSSGFFDPASDPTGRFAFDIGDESESFIVTDEAVGFSAFAPGPDEIVIWVLAYGSGQAPDAPRTMRLDCPGTALDETIDVYYGYWLRFVLPTPGCSFTHHPPAGSLLSGWSVYDHQRDRFGNVDPGVTQSVGWTSRPVASLAMVDVFPHPSEDNGAFVRQQYLDFLGRDGDPGGVRHWTASLDSGARARTDLVELFLESPEFGGTATPVNRLYQAYFDRAPDRGGLFFWMDWMRSGRSLAEVSDEFARSPEFRQTYGSLDDGDFVDLVYEQVLGRLPDADGRAFWVEQMANGMTRGQVMVNFSESAEYRDLTASAVLVESLYQGLLQRSPDPSGFEYWTGVAESGAPLDQLIAGMLASDEYYERFASIIDELPGAPAAANRAMLAATSTS
ncbi:MAG: DUF4214 domain-containing protein [Acidimicrobiales bacterium]